MAPQGCVFLGLRQPNVLGFLLYQQNNRSRSITIDKVLYELKDMIQHEQQSRVKLEKKFEDANRGIAPAGTASRRASSVGSVVAWRPKEVTVKGFYNHAARTGSLNMTQLDELVQRLIQDIDQEFMA